METVRTTYPSAVRPEAPGPKARATGDGGPAQPAAGPAAPEAKAPPSITPARENTREQLEALLEQVGDRIQPQSRSLTFRINEEINGVVVSVIDTETEELIRQIPAEAMVRIAETLQRIEASTGNSGFLLTEKA